MSIQYVSGQYHACCNGAIGPGSESDFGEAAWMKAIVRSTTNPHSAPTSVNLRYIYFGDDLGLRLNDQDRLGEHATVQGPVNDLLMALSAQTGLSILF
jgi:hypothetical protein